MTSAVDISVEFMDMANDGRLWTRLSDVRTGFLPVAGRFAVPDGPVEEHRHLLPPR